MPLHPLRPDDPEQVGPYLLTGRLAAGTLGVLYLGHDDDGEPLAVAVVRPELGEDSRFRTRLERDVSALREVEGTCAVRLVDADPAAEPPWLATEYVDGPTLAELVERQGPLPPRALLAVAVALAEALGALHAVGVAHRALRPGTVVVGPAGPRLAFGTALNDDAGPTADGPASDVLAWGTTVAYAATGGPPPAGPERAVAGGTDLAALPGVLAPAVTAALAADPADRPAARDLLALLLPDAEDRYAAATAVVRETWPQAPQLRPPAAAPSRAVSPVVLGVAALVLVLVVALILVGVLA